MYRWLFKVYPGFKDHEDQQVLKERWDHQGGLAQQVRLGVELLLLPWEFCLGRSVFIERPPAFYAQLPRLFLTQDSNRILRPWLLSDSFNPPAVTSHFSPDTGIFTVPKSGLYHFFLTIAVSQARVRSSTHFFFFYHNQLKWNLFSFVEKAIVYLTKNQQRICTLWIDALASESNITFAWGWASNSIDCFIACEADDRIAAMAVYRSAENFQSQIYGYSYSVFSGYMIAES